MEEGSIAFSVEGGDGSDEEEDDRQRKAEVRASCCSCELSPSLTPSPLTPSPPHPSPLTPPQLHQLLTEQLQDDLLDDSVSTVTTEEGAADSTLLGDEVGVSLDHVISPHQSCDLTTSLHDEGEGESIVDEYLTTDSGQPGINTGQPGINTGQPEINTGQPGINTGQPGINTGQPWINTGPPGINTGQPGINTGQPGTNTGPPGINTGQPGINTGQPGINMVPPVSAGRAESGERGLTREVSDVFSGTAQAYSIVQPPSVTSDLSAPPSKVEKDITTQEVVADGRSQLEVLYGARCRQVTVLSQQLQEASEEGERQARLLRHEKVSVCVCGGGGYSEDVCVCVCAVNERERVSPPHPHRARWRTS